MKLKNVKNFLYAVCISGIILSLPVLTACDTGNGAGNNTTPLTVRSTYPAGDAVSVAINF